MVDDIDRRVAESSTDDRPRDIETSLDTVFRVLSNRTRLFALYALQDLAEGVVDLESLVEEVATLTVGLADHSFTRDRYVDIAADLYFWHLPVLADVGVVDYDTRHHTIRYESSTNLETWVRRVRREELGC